MSGRQEIRSQVESGNSRVGRNPLSPLPEAISRNAMSEAIFSAPLRLAEVAAKTMPYVPQSGPRPGADRTHYEPRSHNRAVQPDRIDRVEHPIRNRRRQFLKTALAVTLPSLAAQPPREKPVAGARNRFRLRIAANLKPFDAYAPILDIPGVLTVRLRRHDPSDRARQNYPAFPMPDGSVPVLEAELKLHSDEHPDWRSMTVGVPLAMLKKPWGAHDIVLDFSAVRWTLYEIGRASCRERVLRLV